MGNLRLDFAKADVVKAAGSHKILITNVTQNLIPNIGALFIGQARQVRNISNPVGVVSELLCETVSFFYIYNQ